MTVRKKLERLFQKNPELTLAEARKKLGKVSNSTFYKLKADAKVPAFVLEQLERTDPLTIPNYSKKKDRCILPSNSDGNDGITLDELDSTRKLIKSMGSTKLTNLVKKLESSDCKFLIVSE